MKLFIHTLFKHQFELVIGEDQLSVLTLDNLRGIISETLLNDINKELAPENINLIIKGRKVTDYSQLIKDVCHDDLKIIVTEVKKIIELEKSSESSSSTGSVLDLFSQLLTNRSSSQPSSQPASQPASDPISSVAARILGSMLYGSLYNPSSQSLGQPTSQPTSQLSQPISGSSSGINAYSYSLNPELTRPSGGDVQVIPIDGSMLMSMLGLTNGLDDYNTPSQAPSGSISYGPVVGEENEEEDDDDEEEEDNTNNTHVDTMQVDNSMMLNNFDQQEIEEMVNVYGIPREEAIELYLNNGKMKDLAISMAFE